MQSGVSKSFLYPDLYTFSASQENSRFRNLEQQVKSFVDLEKGGNRLLYEFKNILLNTLEEDVASVDKLSMDKISVLYTPFVFSVLNLPFEVCVALTVSSLKIKTEEIAQLAKVGRETIYYEAKMAIVSSLTFGNGYMDEALTLLQGKGTTYEKIKKAIGDTVNLVLDKLKSTGDSISNFLSKARNFFDVTGTDTDTIQYMEKVMQLQQLKNGYSGAIGGEALIKAYMRNIRLYGKILIDFYYILNFALKTSAYGREVYYIPKLPSILFELKNGILTVYYKGENSISVIPETEFTEEFLYGLAKGMRARENADVISKYNENVSEQKESLVTKRSAFKKALQDEELQKLDLKAKEEEYKKAKDGTRKTLYNNLVTQIEAEKKLRNSNLNGGI